jgi:hypothetical protein
MNAGELVTLVVAIWGAALSTFLAVRQLRRDRPELRLFVMPTHHPSGRLEAAWRVRVANPSARPIEVTTVALVDHNGLQASMEDPVPPIEVCVQGRPVPGLPVILGDGESLEVVLPEPLPERFPRGAWALDSFHRLHFVAHPPKRSKSRAKIRAALFRVRDRAGRALNTRGWREREFEQQQLERRARRLVERGVITPIPPRAPFAWEQTEGRDTAPDG